MTSASSSPAPGNEPDEILSPEQLLKKYQRMYREQKDIAENKSKRKRAGRDSVTQLGRGIRKAATMFESVSTVINDGEQYEDELETREDDALPIDRDGELTDEEIAVIALKRDRERTYGAYKIIKTIVPGLNNLLTSAEPTELKEYFNTLQSGANSARAHDANSLGKALANWLNTSKNGIPNPVFVESRSNRGIQHDVAGGLLCPVDYAWNDEEVRTAIRNGTKPLNISFYCNFLYPNGTGNPQDVCKGFTQSNLMVQAYKHRFTSPSSADDTVDDDDDDGDNHLPARVGKKQKNNGADKSARSTVAELLGLNNRVTPRTIAYIAVLVHFALTDLPTWNKTQGHYLGVVYRDFYNFIVDFFEDVQEEQDKKDVQKILDWWNRKVFPHAHGSSTASGTAIANNSRDRLRNQRAARRV